VEAQELKNPLRVWKKDKLRRVSYFRHRVITARSAEALEPSDGFRVLKAQEDQCFYMCDEAPRVRSSQRIRKAKVEAFGKLNFFPVLEESAEAQEGAQLSLDGQ
jgi:hypothetical protein